MNKVLNLFGFFSALSVSGAWANDIAVSPVFGVNDPNETSLIVSTGGQYNSVGPAFIFEAQFSGFRGDFNDGVARYMSVAVRSGLAMTDDGQSMANLSVVITPLSVEFVDRLKEEGRIQNFGSLKYGEMEYTRDLALGIHGIVTLRPIGGVYVTQVNDSDAEAPAYFKFALSALSAQFIGNEKDSNFVMGIEYFKTSVGFSEFFPVGQKAALEVNYLTAQYAYGSLLKQFTLFSEVAYQMEDWFRIAIRAGWERANLYTGTQSTAYGRLTVSRRF